MSEENTVHAVDNGLGFLDDMISSMENDTQRKANVNDEDRVRVVFLPRAAKFKFRFLKDKNQKLYHRSWVYGAEVEVPGDDGQPTSKKVRALAPPRDKDELVPLVDQLDNWRLKAKGQDVFYGVLTEIMEGEDNYFKPGPCMLVANCSANGLLNGLKSAMVTLYQSEQGKVALGTSLDPTKGSTGFVIDHVGGKGGNTSVQFDPYGSADPIKPEIQDQFDDVTKAYCPEEGPTNDANYQLIKVRYEAMLNDSNSFHDPSKEAPAVASNPLANLVGSATQPAPQAQAPLQQAPAPSTGASGAANDLEAALNGQG